jgi:hypothetical protein
MKEGFLFYGVDVFADQAAVVEAVEGAAPIFPDLADTPAALPDQAMVAAEQAADMSRAVSGLEVKERFVHGHLPRQSAFALYGYEQIYHGKWFIGVNLQTERGGQQEKTQFISMDYCAF